MKFKKIYWIAVLLKTILNKYKRRNKIKKRKRASRCPRNNCNLIQLYLNFLTCTSISLLKLFCSVWMHLYIFFCFILSLVVSLQSDWSVFQINLFGAFQRANKKYIVTIEWKSINKLIDSQHDSLYTYVAIYIIIFSSNNFTIFYAIFSIERFFCVLLQTMRPHRLSYLMIL